MDNIMRFSSNMESVNKLCSADQRLNKLIHLIGDLELQIKTNYFESLVLSIVGQQLSSRAASTIRSRIKILCNGEITPTKIKSISLDDLRSAGLSRAKVNYIHDLAEKVDMGQVNFSSLSKLSNDEVINILTAVKGIGKWTAEMFLIFALGRLDVLSYGDAGLQRAARWLYNLHENPKGNYLKQVDHKWAPFQSIVSLYLWEAIDRGFVDSGKTIEDLVNAN